MSNGWLRERWVAARGYGWWNLLVLSVVAVLVTFSGRLIVQGVTLAWPGIPGTVTITGCELDDGWNCDGRFVSTDGTVRIDQVRIYPYFDQDEEPSGTVAAEVPGPGATWADTVNEFVPVPLWGGIAMGLIGVYMLYTMYFKREPDEPAGR